MSGRGKFSMLVFPGIWALALLIGAPACGQICTLDDNLQSCFQSVHKELAAKTDQKELASQADQVEAQAAEVVPAEIKSRATGVSDAVVPGAGTVTDFLPLLSLAFDSGSLEGDDGGSFSLDLNDFLGLSAEDGYKFRAVVRDPEVFEPIKEALPEDVRDERVGSLSQGLDELDDMSLVFSYSPMNKHWGRNPSMHRKAFSRLLEEFKGKYLERETAETFESQDQVLKLIQNLPEEAQQAIAEGGSFRAAGEHAEDLRRSAEAAARAFVVRSQTLRQALPRFFRFADLIDNQPQITFSLDQSVRDQIAGPDELKIAASYEKGWANVNSLREECPGLFDGNGGSDGESGSSGPTHAIDCYARYLTSKRQKALDRGDRLTFRIEYSDVEDYSLDLPADDVSLEIPGDRKLMLSVAYGRYLSFTEGNTGGSRLEVNVSYEDVGNDPAREDRFLGNAILTQRVSEGVFFSVGLAYASDPEMRGAVDQELSARAGLTYKLIHQKDEEF